MEFNYSKIHETLSLVSDEDFYKSFNQLLEFYKNTEKEVLGLVRVKFEHYHLGDVYVNILDKLIKKLFYDFYEQFLIYSKKYYTNLLYDKETSGLLSYIIVRKYRSKNYSKFLDRIFFVDQKYSSLLSVGFF